MARLLAVYPAHGRRRVVAAWSVLLCCLALSCRPVAAGEGTNVAITIGWTPPSRNQDGTNLADLGGHKVYYGTGSRDYDQVVDVGGDSSATVTGLHPHRVYYFAVTAYDVSGNESGFSAELAWAHDDTDVDGMSDAWEEIYFGSASAPAAQAEYDMDRDGVTNLAEFRTGSSPWDMDSHVGLQIHLAGERVQIATDVPAALGDEYAGYARHFRIERCSDAAGGNWIPLQDWEAAPAAGPVTTTVDGALGLSCAYRVVVWLHRLP